MAAKDEFALTVMNEKGVLYYGQCEVLFLPSVKGEVAVMKHHTPMIMKLSPGKVRITIGHSKKDIVNVQSGVVYVAEDTVSVLADL
jgi:F-type H+-transporting ATPase subunit epsilon